MKTILTLALAICVIGCSQEVPFSEPKQEDKCPPTNISMQKDEAKKSEIIEIKVINWGPQNTITGTNPNRQPDGSLGLWFQLNTTKGMSEVLVFFDGQPAISSTIAGDDLVTAAISKELITLPGKKPILITTKDNKVEIFKGEFYVSSE